MEKIIKTQQQWLDQLDPETYRITRQKGTEPAFSGALYGCETQGEYLCSCCAQVLFTSHSKYDSGSGWPSFFEPANQASVIEHKDISHGMNRTEITCAKCDAHLGHVFSDGPEPTGLRYCINSASLSLHKTSDDE